MPDKMTAHFYILAKSFRNNANYANDEIEIKVKRLAEDVLLIHNYKETNKLYTNYEEVYAQSFYADYTILDFICSPHILKAKGIDRDVINALQNIFQKSESTNLTSKEVKEELLNWADDENCHGLIAFHKIEDLQDSFQIIYGIDGWYKFRRHYLGAYPKNEIFFIDECIKYFPYLLFHSRNKETVGEILPNFSISIIKHLGYLDNVFYTYKERHFDNESEKYKCLTVECQLEEAAASKDNNNAKQDLTFEFFDHHNQPVNITCYPHLRLSKSDIAGDSKYYFNRIYFHEGVESIAKGKILIGHIGKHRD